MREKEKLRILHVISGDLWAGAEVMAYNLLLELRNYSQVELLIAVMNHGRLADEIRSSGVAVEVIDESRMGGVKVFGKLRKISRAFQPHVIHTHRQKENILGTLASIGARAKSIRTVHGGTEFELPHRDVFRQSLRFVDHAIGRYIQCRVVAVSEDLGKKLIGSFGPSKVRIIENGIDVSAVRSLAMIPSNICVDTTKRSIGIVARLVPVKRHDRFISAAEYLLERFPDKYQFHIVGDGPKREVIHNRIERSRYGSNILLHGFRNDAASIIAMMDAIVVCSDHEGLPMSVLEAAVVNTPIVTTPLASVRNVLKSGISGIVCNGTTSEDLAAGIADCLSQHRTNSNISGAEWTYSAANMAAKYYSLYRDVMA